MPLVWALNQGYESLGFINFGPCAGATRQLCSLSSYNFCLGWGEDRASSL